MIKTALKYCPILLLIAWSAFGQAPVVTITSPTNNQFFSNTVPLVVRGTATDPSGSGITSIQIDLVPLAAADGTFPNGGLTNTQIVPGNLNWSVTFTNLLPGTYEVGAVATDLAGNSNVETFIPVIFSAIFTNGLGYGTVTFAQGSYSDLDAVGYPFQVGSNYSLTASASQGVFLDWTDFTNISTDSTLDFDYTNGFLATATFTVLGTLNVQSIGPGTISPVTDGESIPVGTTFQVTATPNSDGAFYGWSTNQQTFLSGTNQTFTMTPTFTLQAFFVSNNYPNLFTITNPSPGESVGPSNIVVGGMISSNINTNIDTVTVTYQTFQNGVSVTPIVSAQGETAWSSSISLLTPGAYQIIAFGSDYLNNWFLTNLDFTVSPLGNLNLVIVGDGTVSPIVNGELLGYNSNFTATATPNPGSIFYGWTIGSQTTTTNTLTFSMQEGLTLTATFVATNMPKGVTITSPAPKGRVATSAFSVKGRVAPSFLSANVSVQIFDSSGQSLGPPMMTNTVKNNWSVNVSNMVGGNYVVEVVATNAEGLEAIASEPFSLLPYASVAGTYEGLFIAGNAPVCMTNSGLMSFSVSATGDVTAGKLLLPAYPALPINGEPFQFSGTGLGIINFAFASFYGHPIECSLYVDLLGPSDLAAGTISSISWYSPLFCFRDLSKLSTNTVAVPGRYVMSLTMPGPTNAPATNGYIALNITAGGALNLSGALPDNTTFSQSSRVGDVGIWPLFALPAGDQNRGMILGWVTNSPSGAISGNLNWYKAAGVGKYETAGIGLETNFIVTVTGTNFVRPPAGSNYTIIFQGGSLAAPLTNSLTVSPAGQFIATGSPSDKLKITLSVNGILTGSFLDPAINRTTAFKGAFMSPAQGGSGFFPDLNGQVGTFTLSTNGP